MCKPGVRFSRYFVPLSAFLAVLMVTGAGLNRVEGHLNQAGSTAIALKPIVTGLTNPLLITNAHDNSNRLFILEQTGAIKVLPPGSAAPTVFLNISSKILSGGERGLLGLAFHPQYETNRRFFVNYTRTGDGALVIAEYHASAGNPNVADTAEIVLLTIPHSAASNHNGGMIEFGPDGFLYIATGDGGSANDPPNNAQNINELLGKILRIDVDTPNGAIPYSSPTSNPFFGATPGRDEIYAFGMRNPWRFSFDAATGQLIVGDVGQGSREEIDIITSGGNYGWRIMEGSICNPNLSGGVCTPPANHIAPIAEYSHAAGRCSITGGYVYRGTQSTLPGGAYVFGDLCTGEIFQLLSGVQTLLLNSDLTISSFGEDEMHELYVADHQRGIVYQIVEPGPDDTVGLYNGSTSQFFLRNSNTSAPADLVFTFGSAGAGWTPLAGDWNGDGVDTIGLYDPASSSFFLRNLNTSAPADLSFGYGPAAAGWIPIAGDWNGDGVDSVGLYKPSTSTFFLRNSNSTGPADIVFNYGPAGAGWLPLAGDWNGDGIDTVGLYNPGNSGFFLRNSNTSAPADLVFLYGPAGAGWVPLAGDWNGDGIDTIGLFNPQASTFFLRDTNTSSSANLVFSYGPAGAGWKPVIRDWNGS